jgi:Tol biopolymer transport system component
VVQEAGRCFVVVNGKEGPSFEMVVSPMFSPDGTKLVYRAREGGKRFVVVADADGRVIRRQPEYEMVFSTVFTEDGSSVAYGAKNGNELWWKVEKL